MKLIRKMQTAAGGPLNYDYSVQSDNTRVFSPYVVLPFTKKLWEQELLRRNLERRRQAVVTSDNRSTWLKQQDLKKAKEVLLLELEVKNQEAAAKATEGLMRMASPSTYVGFAMGNTQGTGTGSLASDFLTDALVFGGPSLIRGGLGYLSNSGYKLATKPAPWRNYTFGSFMPLPSKVPTLSLSFLVASYPGYLLKGLMTGSQLEKLLSKVGTIDINLLNAYFNKASQLEREVVNKVLTEKFTGLKTIDYNLLKKAVLDELIGSYNRVPLTEWADYGVESLGYNLKTVGENELPGLPNLIILGLPIHYTPPGTKADPINLSTFTFESTRIPYGNTKHYGGNPIGHSRTYTLPEDPHTLYVMESQSDWAQAKKGLNQLDPDYYENNLQNVYNRTFNEIEKSQQELNLAKKNFEKGLYINGNVIPEFNMEGASTLINTMEKELAEKQTKLSNLDMILHPEKYVLENYLKQNYLQRQLQENLRYATENGQTKMRYPTSETAAKIEGYLKVNHTLLNELSNLQMKLGELFENGEISWEEYDKMIDAINKLKKELFGKEYDPKYQTILRKYADFPKLYLKLYKGQNVRTVTDTKGNTWYEVDVPENYLNMEWQFKQGGILQFLKNGSGIHIKKENRGKFTDYCGGKVTSSCIARGKASSDPAVRKRATFAANARKWKHQDGGLIMKGLFGIPGGFTADKQEIDRRNQAFSVLGNKALEEGGFTGPGFRHMFSDLQDLGVLPRGGEDGVTYGIFLPGISGGVNPGASLSKLYPNATRLVKSTDESFLNFVENLSKGRITPRFSLRNLAHDFVTSSELSAPTVPKGFVLGNEVTVRGVEPISETGLSVVKVEPVTLLNYVMNPAEKLAALDFLAENPGSVVETQLPIGRPSGNYKYPVEALLKYGIGKYTTPQTTTLSTKLTTTLSAQKSKLTKTNALRSKLYLRTKEEDKVNKVNSLLSLSFKEAEAFATNDARKVHVTGRTYSKSDNELLKKIEANIHLYPGSVLSEVRKFRVREQKMKEKGRPDTKALNKVRRELREYLRGVRDLYGVMGRKYGGTINFFKKGNKAFVKGVNVLDSNPDAYKYVKKKYKMRSALQGAKFDWGLLASAGASLLNSYLSTKASNKKEIDSNYLTQIASLELERNLKSKDIPYYAQMIASKMQKNINPENPNAYAGIPAQILPYKIADYLLSQNDKEYNDKIKALEIRSQLLKDLSNTDFWMGAAQEGLGFLMNNIGKGTSNTSFNTGNLSSGTTPLTNSSININNQYSLMNQNPQYWTSKYSTSK